MSLTENLPAELSKQLSECLRWEAFAPVIWNEEKLFSTCIPMLLDLVQKNPNEAKTSVLLLKKLSESRCALSLKAPNLRNLDGSLLTCPSISLEKTKFSEALSLFKDCHDRGLMIPVLISPTQENLEFFCAQAYALCLLSETRGPIFLAAPNLHEEYGILNVSSKMNIVELKSAEVFPSHWSRYLILGLTHPC